MKVIIIGNGGREHALVWTASQSELVSQVVCLGGNGGTALEEKTTNMRCDLGRVESAASTISAMNPDLVIVGPEQPLVAGLGSRLRSLSIPTVGPSHLGAQLEGSKSFAKSLMVKAGVPTAEFQLCRTMAEAENAISDFGDQTPVIKADGLAGGKGVSVPETPEEAILAAREALVNDRFGEAGRAVLVEERLVGVEASYIVMATADGDDNEYVPFPTSQDHKR